MPKASEPNHQDPCGCPPNGPHTSLCGETPTAAQPPAQLTVSWSSLHPMSQRGTDPPSAGQHPVPPPHLAAAPAQPFTSCLPKALYPPSLHRSQMLWFTLGFSQIISRGTPALQGAPLTISATLWSSQGLWLLPPPPPPRPLPGCTAATRSGSIPRSLPTITGQHNHPR